MFLVKDMIKEENKRTEKSIVDKNKRLLKHNLDILAKATLEMNKEWCFVDTTIDKTKSNSEIINLYNEIYKIRPAEYKNLRKFIEYNTQQKKIKTTNRKKMHSEYETRRRNIINLGINAMVDFFDQKTTRSKKEIVTEAVKLILELKLKELKHERS